MSATLGLIGSGMIGGTLARLAVAAGWQVVLSNSRGPDTLADLVGELGPLARAAHAQDAAQAADLVVATIPLNRYRQLPADTLRGRVVVDTMNYYPDRDGRIPELDAGEVTSSELVQLHLPGARVVKAFNSIDYHRLLTSARASGAADRSALPIAGDDHAAKRDVTRLLDTFGYDAVDVGGLADSWRIQPGTPCYVQPYSQPRPQDADADSIRRWFFETPGVPVPATRLEQLVADARR